MNTIRLGLFQESTDRFALSIHEDAVPTRLYQEFSAGELRAAIVATRDGGSNVQLMTVPAEVAQARDLFFKTISRDPESVVTGGVMALETFSDSWNMTLLRDSAPGYHVALAFSFFPLRVSFREGSLIHIAYEVAELKGAESAWYMVQPALVEQTAAILFPDVPTGADACALLANRTGVVDYLMGLGDTFSLSDIEQLARAHQVTSSTVIASAQGIRREDATWLYQVKLSERAVASAELLAVSYARAKARRIAGLRNRRPREGLSDDQIQYWEAQIERFAHHLALLELCVEYGIGLWSCPMTADRGEWLDSETDEPADQWSVAVNPE